MHFDRKIISTPLATRDLLSVKIVSILIRLQDLILFSLQFPTFIFRKVQELLIIIIFMSDLSTTERA